MSCRCTDSTFSSNAARIFFFSSSVLALSLSMASASVFSLCSSLSFRDICPSSCCRRSCVSKNKIHLPLPFNAFVALLLCPFIVPFQSFCPAGCCPSSSCSPFLHEQKVSLFTFASQCKARPFMLHWWSCCATGWCRLINSALQTQTVKSTKANAL